MFHTCCISPPLRKVRISGTAQAPPATMDYGTFSNTPEEPSNFLSPPTSYNPDSSVRTTSSQPQCKEEEWMYAVLVTKSMMYNYPHSKYFPQCNFNPNGRRLVVPQIVEAVPTGEDIREFLKTEEVFEDLKFCNHLLWSLRSTQKHLINGGLLVLTCSF